MQKWSWSALHIACAKANIPVLRVLLSFTGLDLGAREHDNLLAAEFVNPDGPHALEILSLLRDAGAHLGDNEEVRRTHARMILYDCRAC